MAQEIIEYADFSGGDYGRLENWRAPKNTFSGENMLVYRTGELGVRPGLRDVSPTGLANGEVAALGGRGVLGSPWFAQGTALRYFTPGVTGAVSTASGSFDAEVFTVFADGTTSTAYLATDNTTGIYTFQGTTLAQLANSMSAQAIALYGDRLAVVPRSATNTVVFSGAADFDNWTISAGNAVSITVGDDTAITALIAQRGHLVILKQNQAYILSGTPGTNESLRLIGRINGPSEANAAAKTYDLETVWYPDSLNNVPTSFDGSRASQADSIALPPTPSDTSVIATPGDDTNGVLFITEPTASLGATRRVWLRNNGRWTQHTFGVTITDQATVTRGIFSQDASSDTDNLRYGSCIVFTDGGGESADPTFYGWMPFMDRPGLETDPLPDISATSYSIERAGDASATPVSGSALLAEQRARDGRELQVRGVIVDFRSWDTGGDANNHFDLAVNTLNSYEASGPVSSATLSFDEDPSLSDLAGTVRSKYFSLGDQGRGSALNVQLSNCRGIAIQRIRIVCETYPPRGF